MQDPRIDALVMEDVLAGARKDTHLARHHELATADLALVVLRVLRFEVVSHLSNEAHPLWSGRVVFP